MRAARRGLHGTSAAKAAGGKAASATANGPWAWVAVRGLAGVAVGLALVAACDVGSDPPGTAAVRAGPVEYGPRDSAGVVVVENAKPPEGSRLGWTVSLEPVVSIGTQEGEGEWQLHSVEDATKLADGRIVVANGGSRQLLVFDEAGEYMAAWGGPGEGPGEFGSLNSVARWPGDSIMASDVSQNRMTIFHADGSHGRTTKLEGRAAGMLAGALATLRRSAGHVALDVLPNHTLLTRNDDIHRTSGFWRQEHVYELKDADGGAVASLGAHGGPETYTESVDVPEEKMIYLTPIRHPFGKRTEWAIWGELVALGRTETYEIRAYRSDGTVARIVRRDNVAPAPTQVDLDAGLRDYIASRPEGSRERLREVAPNVPMVETFPAFGPIRGDALGHLWVAEFKRPGDDSALTTWTVFDQEGVALGFVETPAQLDVYEIGADYVLGKTTDEFDVEYMQVWALERE